MLKQLLKFCEAKRIVIDLAKFNTEYLVKETLVRNPNENHRKFYLNYIKYLNLLEELQARQDKQQEFIQDIQIIAERRNRPAKAEKEFSRRNKKQSKLSTQTGNLTLRKKELELDLMSYWLQFNNYIANVASEYQSLPTYNHRKQAPFLINTYVDQSKRQGLLKDGFEGQIFEQSVPNLVDKLITTQSIFSVISEINVDVLKHKNIHSNNSMITLCTSLEESKIKQYQIVEQLRASGQYEDIQVYLTPPQCLENYEASRIEIVGYENNTMTRLAYCSNCLQHISERYFLADQPKPLMVITTIE